MNNLSESEEQGVGGKMPILQPDAVLGGWEEAHLTPDDPCSFRTAETMTNYYMTMRRSIIPSLSTGNKHAQLYSNSDHPDSEL